MSRIGKHPVPVPAGVTVQVTGQTVTAKGKLGQLSLNLIDEIEAKLEGGNVVVLPRTETVRARQNWATARTNVANLVTGVDKGFTRNLEITGRLQGRCRWFGAGAEPGFLARHPLPHSRGYHDEVRQADVHLDQRC